MKKTILLLFASALIFCQSVEAQQRRTASKTKTAAKTSIKLPNDPELVAKAKAGDPVAQNEMGDCYLNALKGAPENDEEALKWYKLSADQGYAIAIDNIGDCYYYGYGVEEDEAKAKEYYAKAVPGLRELGEKGNGEALHRLANDYQNGWGVEKDEAKYDELIQKAAEAGHAESQNIYGDVFYRNEDYATAVQWYQKAAAQGHAKGAANLGFCYETGKGLAQSYTEALKWYKKGVDGGSRMAMEQLGILYENGNGVTLNLQLAKKYYKQAADLDSEYAKNALERLDNPNSSAARAANMKTKIGPKKSAVYIDRDFCVRHPINVMSDGGSNSNRVEAGSYVDVVVKKCPKGGNCIIFNIHFVEDGSGYDLTFSWSGADTHLYDFGVGYIPVRGSLMNPRSSGTSLTYVSDRDQWVLTLGRNCNWMIGAGLKEGMTREEVNKGIAGQVPGTYTNGTQCGNLTLYGFKSYALEKQYHINGDYHYNATTKNYLDLYFDANGKLDRWCTNF